MPPTFLLDTHICIYIIGRRPAEVLARFEKLKAGEAVLSVITWGELHFGAAKSKKPKRNLSDSFRTEKLFGSAGVAH